MNDLDMWTTKKEATQERIANALEIQALILSNGLLEANLLEEISKRVAAIIAPVKGQEELDDIQRNAGAYKERAAIVEWLRSGACVDRGHPELIFVPVELARRIDNGEHHRKAESNG